MTPDALRPDLGATLLAALAGVALGALYFGALWASLRRLPEQGSLAPGRFLLEFALRLVGVLAGFGALLVVFGAAPWPLLAALLGFGAARVAVTRTLGPTARRRGEDGGAPWS